MDEDRILDGLSYYRSNIFELLYGEKWVIKSNVIGLCLQDYLSP